MLRQNLLTLFVLLITVVLISGCSGGSNSGVTPSIDSGQDAALSGLPVGVSDWDADMAPVGGIGALGVFNLHVEPSNLSAELVPLRENMLTDVLEVVDITNFLRMAPCYDCAKIDSISLDADGHLVISIGIKHPFDAGDLLMPITGKNRADLHVFNVEGTIVSNASGTTFPNLNETASDFTLVNADGYSCYLDDVLDDIYPTDATIHPYILHFDDYSIGNFDPSNAMGFYSVTDPPPSGNLVMAMGCDYNYQDYVFDFGADPIDFIYVVGCTYAISAENISNRFFPEYRIPQHNKKAASEVSIEIISNDLTQGDPALTAEIEIRVVDINHDVATGTHLDEMFADSSVSAITIDLPGVESAIVNVDISSPTGIGHDPTDPLVFPATITNSADAEGGTHVGLIKVVDSYSSGLNELPLLNGKDGIKRVEPAQNPVEDLFQIDEFATYMVFTIDVFHNNPPVAVLSPEFAEIYECEYVKFDATASYDPDGTIDLYEFDFDWDGTEANFTADASNTTGKVTSSSYDFMGFYIAGVRVTDNLGKTDYASSEITVLECLDTLTSWDMTLPDMTTPRYYAGQVTIGNQIWIIGGDSGGGGHESTIEVFDMETETWDLTPRTPLPEWRCAFAVSHYEGKIYCMCGHNYQVFIASQVVYDIATDTWDESHPDCSLARSVTKSVVYQDEIYLAYGWNAHLGLEQNILEIYDPISRTWREGASAPHSRAGPVWIIMDDRIYGMSSNRPIGGSSSIEYYEPASDSWTVLSATMSRWRADPGIVKICDRIYLIGGSYSMQTSYNWVDSFDIVTETWRQEIDLPEIRGHNVPTAYYKCKLYIAAGRGSWYENIGSVRVGIFE